MALTVEKLEEFFEQFIADLQALFRFSSSKKKPKTLAA
jgi:hypothetical protein